MKRSAHLIAIELVSCGWLNNPSACVLGGRLVWKFRYDLWSNHVVCLQFELIRAYIYVSFYAPQVS